MANKRKAAKDKELLAPMWVTTYSDLISLLVTFFVLLFTFSTMEEDKFRRVKGTLGGGMGAMTPDKTQSRPNVRSVKVPANATTSAVRLPPGRHRLDIDYVADPTGLCLPLALLGALALALRLWWRARNPLPAIDPGEHDLQDTAPSSAGSARHALTDRP